MSEMRGKDCKTKDNKGSQRKKLNKIIRLIDGAFHLLGIQAYQNPETQQHLSKAYSHLAEARKKLRTARDTERNKS